MTDDELDLLASAYVDGEATPEEVALVERDPELLARVEEFRSLDAGREAVTAPAGLAERHLAVAMAEFAAGSAAAPAPVVDLRERRSSRADRAARPPRGLPTWLPAAAAFILIGGGVIWALGRLGSGDDDSMDTATAEFDSGDDATDESTDEEASEDIAAESAVMADDAADDAGSAESADAVAAAPTDDTDQARAADEGSDATAEDGEGTMATTTMVAPTQVPPMASYDSIPDLDTVTDLPEPITEVELSRCGFEVVTPGLGEIVGFVPVLVAGEEAEVFVFRQGDGTELRLLFDADCQPLEP